MILQTRQPDEDLECALRYNPQKEFCALDIVDVHATIAGGNDEFNWYWVVQLQDGWYVLIDAWCDYTGWDCQSGVDCSFTTSALDAARLAPEVEEYSARHIQEQLIAQIEGRQPYGLYIQDTKSPDDRRTDEESNN